MSPADFENSKQESTVEKSSTLSEPLKGNLYTIAQFYEREERRKSSHQTAIERLCTLCGQPIYLVGTFVFVVFWIAINLYMDTQDWLPFDPSPFFWLQGLIGLIGLLLTIAILVRQNQMADLADQHAHLDLQVNLLAEQKATKIIQLLEELREDLPNVKNRYDPEAEELKLPTDTNAVLNALKTQKLDPDQNQGVE
jgi:uncharacterized membrane protein